MFRTFLTKALPIVLSAIGIIALFSTEHPAVTPQPVSGSSTESQVQPQQQPSPLPDVVRQPIQQPIQTPVQTPAQTQSACGPNGCGSSAGQAFSNGSGKMFVPKIVGVSARKAVVALGRLRPRNWRGRG